MSQWIQMSKYGFIGSKRAHFLWFRVLQCNICKILAFLGQIVILCTIGVVFEQNSNFLAQILPVF